MFFVTLLLENVVTWMYRQTGTTSLRALLYFDEIFGFFPAVAEPPSKRPLLTLLKQARALGLGCILASQNPIDIDYKGLTNAGTWFIGKLQAQRDIERVSHGLRGTIAKAGHGAEKVGLETLIGRLNSRLFLMHSIYRDRPLVLQTRWAMSYLRGPLTRPQVQTLMARRKPVAETAQPIQQSSQERPLPSRAAPLLVPAPVAPAGFADTPPSLDPAVSQVFLPVDLSEQAALRQLAQETGQRLQVGQVDLVYEPAIIGGANVRFVDRRRKINERTEKVLLAPAPDDVGGMDWDSAQVLPLRLDELGNRLELAGSDRTPFFAPVPESANSARELRSIARSLTDWLYYHSRLTLTVHPELDVFWHPGERERAFKIRLRQAARERRDAEVDKLSQKYETRIARIETRLRREERELVADEAEYDARKKETRLTMGETALETEIAALEAELEAATREITRKWADLLDDLTIEEIHPRRTDVDVRLLALAWLPSWRITYDDGVRTYTATIAAYVLPQTGPPGPF